MKKTGIIIISLCSFILIWVLIAYSVDQPLLVPYPHHVFITLCELIITPADLMIIVMTSLRLLIAIFISACLAMILGLIAGFNETFASFLRPYITILRTVPVISIVVILLIFLGFRLAPYVITFLMVFPIIYQATYQAKKSIDPQLEEALKLENQHVFLTIFRFYLPLMKPYLYLSFLQSFGLGLKVLVMAEYLAQTRQSIGYEIYVAKVNIAYDRILAWTIILILISVVIELGIQHAKEDKHIIDKVDEKRQNNIPKSDN